VDCHILRLISLRHKTFLRLFVCPSLWLISKTTEIIRNHSVLERYARKFPVNYNFSFYRYATTITLHEAQVDIHRMSQPKLWSVRSVYMVNISLKESKKKICASMYTKHQSW
jgi:hypothetical protein